MFRKLVSLFRALVSLVSEYQEVFNLEVTLGKKLSFAVDVSKANISCPSVGIQATYDPYTHFTLALCVGFVDVSLSIYGAEKD